MVLVKIGSGLYINPEHITSIEFNSDDGATINLIGYDEAYFIRSKSPYMVDLGRIIEKAEVKP